jgi:hypothetical protein
VFEDLDDPLPPRPTLADRDASLARARQIAGRKKRMQVVIAAVVASVFVAATAVAASRPADDARTVAATSDTTEVTSPGTTAPPEMTSAPTTMTTVSPTTRAPSTRTTVATSRAAPATTSSTNAVPPDDDISHQDHAIPPDAAIRLSFALSTTHVRSGQTLSGQLVIENRGDADFQYDKGCDPFNGLYRDGRHVGGQAAWTCGDGVTETVASGKSVTLDFIFDTASDPNHSDGTRAPLPPGVYQAAAGLHRGAGALWFGPYVNITIDP